MFGVLGFCFFLFLGFGFFCVFVVLGVWGVGGIGGSGRFGEFGFVLVLGGGGVVVLHALCSVRRALRAVSRVESMFSLSLS